MLHRQSSYRCANGSVGALPSMHPQCFNRCSGNQYSNMRQMRYPHKCTRSLPGSLQCIGNPFHLCKNSNSIHRRARSGCALRHTAWQHVWGTCTCGGTPRDRYHGDRLLDYKLVVISVQAAGCACDRQPRPLPLRLIWGQTGRRILLLGCGLPVPASAQMQAQSRQLDAVCYSRMCMLDPPRCICRVRCCPLPRRWRSPQQLCRPVGAPRRLDHRVSALKPQPRLRSTYRACNN